jgi:L-fuculose-phosphate aldolase/L-ribulose-5-phosphate 4-epimerase
MAGEQSIRSDVVSAARQISNAGLVIGTAGNVSARQAGASRFWITPSGVEYARLTPGRLVEIDLAGTRRRGRLKPSSDFTNHAAIYRRRPDVACIVHTHSTYASVFAVLHQRIPALLVEAAGYLGGEVTVMSYLPPASPEFGERAADGLGAHRAVLLPNHGVIAVGESVESAVTAALLVEQSARVAYLANLVGKPRLLPKGEVERIHTFLHTEYGQRLRRRND